MSNEVEKKRIMEMNETYWQDVHQKVPDQEMLKSEFPENTEYNYLETSKSRRNFLKIMGISVVTLPLASCFKVPVRKALPYLKKDELSVPGVARWFATTCQGCEANCPLTVKNREGRPIKVEGNGLYAPTGGGCCTLAQGALLGLYDTKRFKTPLVEGKQISWADVDKDLTARLKQAASAKKDIVIVSGESKSPSTLALIEEFSRQFGSKHVIYSPVSNSALAEAHDQVFGVKSIPKYNLEGVDYILSVGADFLNVGTAPVEITRQYANRKDLSKTVSTIKHVQVESIMTLTGSNADERIPLAAGDHGSFLLALLKKLQAKAGVAYFTGTAQGTGVDSSKIEELASRLWAARSKSLVMAGSNDLSIQVTTALINSILGSYDKALLLEDSKHFKNTNDGAVEELITSMEKGKVGAVVFWEVNPAYDYHNVERFNNALKKVPVKVAAALAPNETSKQCNVVLPTNHFFESWGDFYQGQGNLSVSQPLMAPLKGSRMFQETLLSWMGRDGDFYSYMKKYWEKNFYRQQKRDTLFLTFWEKSLQDGVAKIDYSFKSTQARNNGNYNGMLNVSRKPVSGIELLLYEKGHIRDGRWASNPWFQELPDPITKVTWDNYLMISPQLAKSRNLATGEVVKLTANKTSIEVPVLVQPGTEGKSLGLALGYGRTVASKYGKGVGVNGFSLTSFDNRNRSYLADVAISGTGKKVEFALTQTHHSMEGRDIVKETTLSQYVKNPKSGNEKGIKLINMWSEHKKDGQQWAMSIDLNKCTGCSSCVLSCNAENNVSVVGKDEVRKRREMHWLRIDRYYKGTDENPEVVHMPVMCQHCDNAPCETVCPVMATLQSSDGLNQQVYNRCIGTRYCANNCPYKVRRFNWFNYSHDDPYQNMALNPDIVVRTRGVMEKCSMCVSRIQEAKLKMKISGEKQLKDGEIKLACQQSCPADAIVFGDLNDKNSKIFSLLKDGRSYHLLEELNVLPRVSYLTKVRNKD